MKKARVLPIVMTLIIILMLSGAVGSGFAGGQGKTKLVADDINRAAYAEKEAALTEATTSRFSPVEIYDQFEWYVWNFQIDPEIDAVGDFGDGIGTFYFRLFTPEIEKGKKYPVVMVLGGLGSTNSFVNNGYARYGAYYASKAVQSKYPCYVLTFNIPYEACVNYEAELAYIYELGEVVKTIADEFGNVDMNRIYATGRSQGAGWSYELAAVQPDLLAAIMLDCGTTVHTTWGDQCDMLAIADSDVNIYILHGYNDQYIPVNEAYRAYNTLVALGKTNVVMQITDDKHGIENIPMWSNKEITPLMEWLLTQVKGIDCVSQPTLIESGAYKNYRWAGVLALSHIDGWQTAHDYAHWIEPANNDTWNRLKSNVALDYANGKGGTGKWHLGRIRIGDELQTTYDNKRVIGLLSTEEDMAKTISVNAGDVLAITIQGYTGAYGDDWDAFNREWDVDWAIIKGDITNIRLTCEASPEAIVRPATVALANGAGPNLNNSLYTWNAIDGRQVYLKVDLAENFSGQDLEIAFRFTRDLGKGEYASYWHVVKCEVK
jgi:predicted esterase